MRAMVCDEQELRDFIDGHPRLFVLTGAGCSTDSGIPDYRDAEGGWKRAQQPVMFQAFVGQESTRQRYWARSLIGWPTFQRAAPNLAHLALVALEARGQVEVLVTQNVDRLHQRAGSRTVIDLHGRLDRVRCLDCGHEITREDFQEQLLASNSEWTALQAQAAPDGDADLSGLDFSTFAVPPCAVCGGILKPDVVFFGESVPRERVDSAVEHLGRADAMLIVGSSLMVYSGYRFADMATRARKPIAAVNLGRTRADDALALKVSRPCGPALAAALGLGP